MGDKKLFDNAILDNVIDDQLEEVVIKIIADIDVTEMGDTEAAHRFGKCDRKTPNKKTIIHFPNRKHCNRALVYRKKLAKVDSLKYFYSRSKKKVINENLLIIKKKYLVYHDRKLRPSGLILSCFTRDRVLHIKMTEHGKLHNVHHLYFFIIISL